MINKKEVIRMKVPYPSVNAGLALAAHMYICKEAASPKYEYVKCQTLKPYLVMGKQMKHFWDEIPDLARNPFLRPTRIDCDKVFTTSSVEYSDRMMTQNRPDVCDDLFNNVITELEQDGYDEIKVDEAGLKSLSPLVAAILI